MNERLKKLRKELDITQQEFADKLGTARNNIAGYETGKRQPSDAVISLICKTDFPKGRVNETWLRTGEGEMFVETPSSTMDQLKKEFNLDDFSYNLVYQYLKLDAEQRQTVRDFFYNVVETGIMDEDLFGDVPKTPEDLEKEFPPVEPERNKETG